MRRTKTKPERAPKQTDTRLDKPPRKLSDDELRAITGGFEVGFEPE